MSGIKYLITQFKLTKAFILFCLLPFAANATEEVPAEQNIKTHIDFVTFIDPPYIFDPKETSEKGLVERIFIRLMKHTGIDYKIRIMPAKRAELFAQANNNTCVFPIEKSQEREVFFSWVSPILVSKHGFFTNLYKPISLQVLEDAKPYRIGSYLGSGIGDYLESFAYLVDSAPQNEANILKLQADRIDLWASDILTAEHISKQTGIKISASKLDFFTILRAIGCHPSVPKESVQIMREALQFMYKTGEIYSITQRFKADNFSIEDL